MKNTEEEIKQLQFKEQNKFYTEVEYIDIKTGEKINIENIKNKKYEFAKSITTYNRTNKHTVRIIHAYYRKNQWWQPTLI